MGTENKVYQQMLKNESGAVVFGYTGSYNHGSIDTLPEWKAKDKEVTKYINSLADKKRITPIDKKRAGFYLKGGYGLTAEALTTEKASKIASEISVEVGLKAQLPFQHKEFRTAGDMFDAATQKSMAADLEAHLANEQSNKVVFNADDKVVNFSLDAMGTADIVPSLTGDKLGVLSDIQTIPIPAIPAEDGYLQTIDLDVPKPAGFFHQDSSDPFFKNEVFIPAAFDGTHETAIEAYKLEQAAIAGRNFLVDSFTYVPQPETTSSGQLASDKPLVDDQALVGLTTIKPDQDDIDDGVTVQTASPLAIKSMDEISAQNRTDLRGLVESENLYATATSVAQTSLSTKAKIDSQRLLAKEKKENSIFAHNKFQNERIESIANASDEAAESAKWEAYKIRSLQRTRENFENSQDLETPSKPYFSQQLTDIHGEVISFPEVKGIGTSIAEQSSNARELAIEKGQKELASKSNDLTSSVTIGELNAQRVDAAQAKREQMEAYNKSLYSQPSVYLDADTEDKSQTSEKYPAFKTLGDGDGSLHGKDPFRFTTLEYPKNITSDVQYGHYILFYVNVQNKTKYKYHGYNDDGNYKVIGDVIERQTYHQKVTQDVDTQQGFGEITTSSNTQPETGDYTTRYSYNTGAGADPVAFQKEAYGRVYEGGKANILQSNQVTLMRQRQATQGIASRTDLTSRITDSVAMYLPSEVGNTTATKYQGAELGMLGYLALGGADLLGQLQNRDFAGMGDTAVGMIDAAITEGLKKSAVTAADLFSGANTQGSIDKVFGQTVNPFIEVAFESMGVRSFDYTFNFSPKSRPETDEVKAIIQLFRFHMVPELKGTNHRYLTLPSTFDIHYMYQASPEESKENTFYNKIATCVLEDCNVNYAPSGVKSFDDGAPTQITMTLRFMETEMLTKEKVNKGF